MTTDKIIDAQKDNIHDKGYIVVSLQIHCLNDEYYLTYRFPMEGGTRPVSYDEYKRIIDAIRGQSLRSEPAKECDHKREAMEGYWRCPFCGEESRFEPSEQVGCKHEDNLEDIPGGVIDRCPKCGRDELCDCEQVTKKIYKIEVPENCDSVTIKKKIEEMIMVMNEMYSLLNYNNPGTNNYQL